MRTVIASLPAHLGAIQADEPVPSVPPAPPAPPAPVVPPAPFWSIAALAPIAPAAPAPKTTETIDAAAVDLYIDLPSSGAAAPGVPPAAAGTTVDFELPPMGGGLGGGAPMGAPRAPRLATLALYGIGAAAIGAGILIAGGSSWWPRSTPASEAREVPAAAPPVLPGAETPPDRSATTATTLPRPNASVPPVAADRLGRTRATEGTPPPRDAPTAPTTRAPGAPPPPGGASAVTGPRRAMATDAAADAALEAAERLLAAPGSTATAPGRRAVPPRAAAAPGGSASDLGTTAPAPARKPPQ